MGCGFTRPCQVASPRFRPPQEIIIRVSNDEGEVLREVRRTKDGDEKLIFVVPEIRKIKPNSEEDVLYKPRLVDFMPNREHLVPTMSMKRLQEEEALTELEDISEVAGGVSQTIHEEPEQSKQEDERKSSLSGSYSDNPAVDNPHKINLSNI